MPIALALAVMAISSTPMFETAHGQTLSGREYHVSPAGVSTNDGSPQRPLDLATALSAKSPARPGDIIWLHQGIYRGAFKSAVAGTATSPIIVRQYPGERATIDSSSSGGYDSLSITGPHTWFWGFEIASSDTKRVSGQTGSWPQDLRRGYGAVSIAPGTKFINMIVHDNANGLGLWTQSVGGEAYGNVVYYNGWQAPDRAHGHGIYTQNASGSRVIADNIIFNQFSHGIHAYGSEVASLDNITLDGNIAFKNGDLGTGGMYANGRDILLGGYRVAASPVVTNNATYGAQVNVGYSAGCSNGRITNNYFIGGVGVINCSAVVTGNSVYDETWPKYQMAAQYPQNTYYATQPTGTVIRIRPNKYEAGRANIVVYNWGQSGAVSIDISAARLPSGAAYQIRDAQDYFGRPVVEGVNDGRPVNLPLSGLRAAAPIGNVPRQPAVTAPKFAAFVVVPKSSATTLPPSGDPDNPTPEVSLSLSSTSITRGQTCTLSWSAKDATKVSIDPGVGTVGLNGATTIAPQTTTTFTAIATNAEGETARQQVTVQVVDEPTGPDGSGGPDGPDTNPPPAGGGGGATVQITSPVNNAVILNQGTVMLASNVSDPSVTKVEYYRGATLIGTGWGKPFTLRWSYVSTGTYSITARAYRQNALVGTSAPVTIRATRAPVVRLTSPRAGSYAAPASLTLTANVSDPDGTIARVEYYRGSTLVGQATAAPYTVNMGPLTAGSYVLTAKAFDNLGMTMTSAPVSITVAQAPTVSLVSPTIGGTYWNQGTIPLQVAVSGGTIAKVEYYRNGLLIGTSPAAPYLLNWGYVPTGTYVITAKAYTDKGLMVQSAPVSVTVKRR
jgi:parallel beta-helix repeat protein